MMTLGVALGLTAIMLGIAVVGAVLAVELWNDEWIAVIIGVFFVIVGLSFCANVWFEYGRAIAMIQSGYHWEEPAQGHWVKGKP